MNEPKTLDGRDHSLFREKVVELALQMHNLPYRPCGLNADWSVSAWHIGPSKRPNRADEDGPQLYLLDNETDDPGKEYDLVWRATDMSKEDPDTLYEVVRETSLLSCLEEAVYEIRRGCPHELDGTR